MSPVPALETGGFLVFNAPSNHGLPVLTTPTIKIFYEVGKHVALMAKGVVPELGRESLCIGVSLRTEG